MIITFEKIKMYLFGGKEGKPPCSFRKTKGIPHAFYVLVNCINFIFAEDCMFNQSRVLIPLLEKEVQFEIVSFPS